MRYCGSVSTGSGGRTLTALGLLYTLAAWGCSALSSSSTPAASTSAAVAAPVSKHNASERLQDAAVPAVSPAAASVAETARPANTPEPVAAPTPVVDETAVALALPESHSTSIGAPGAGTLEGGVAIPDQGPGFRFNPLRPHQARFGTVELTQAIMRAAAIVDREMPGSVLMVNDLSLEQGGRIKQHGSHQAGRDADILFYMLDAQGKPVPAVGVPIDPQGEGIDFKDLAIDTDDEPQRLDIPRTWRFMQALLEAADPQVQRMFIAEHVRAMLLAQAERVNAPKLWRDRFAMLTCQPEVPHDDHLHVRFYCSHEDQRKGCLDTPPTYPFRLAALKKAGLRPALETPGARAKRRGAVAERTTSVEEAKQKAGPMHEKVVQFLALRDHWVKKPSPGRPYCP